MKDLKAHLNRVSMYLPLNYSSFVSTLKSPPGETSYAMAVNDLEAVIKLATTDQNVKFDHLYH